MPDTLRLTHGIRTLMCAPDGPPVGSDSDALELVGQALQHNASLVVVPAGRLDDGFFVLSTGIAGQIMQKFVNYHLRLAIVGDLTRHLAVSSALRSLVYESNRGHHVWFVADHSQLDERLQRAQHAPTGRPRSGPEEPEE